MISVISDWVLATVRAGGLVKFELILGLLPCIAVMLAIERGKFAGRMPSRMKLAAAQLTWPD
jgi:hypothetical protein